MSDEDCHGLFIHARSYARDVEPSQKNNADLTRIPVEAYAKAARRLSGVGAFPTRIQRELGCQARIALRRRGGECGLRVSEADRVGRGSRFGDGCGSRALVTGRAGCGLRALGRGGGLCVARSGGLCRVVRGLRTARQSPGGSRASRPGRVGAVCAMGRTERVVRGSRTARQG